jgi:hypothetical protein
LSDLAADADRCSRYHQRRRSFFDQVHRWAMFGVIATGSAGFAAVAGNPEIFGAASAVIGAADLLWDLSGKARDHEILHRRFVDVLKRIGGVQSPDLELVGRIDADLNAIYADEPPVYRALNADCHNQVAQSRLGDRAELLYLSFWRRMTMDLFRFANMRLRLDDRPRLSTIAAKPMSGRLTSSAE